MRQNRTTTPEVNSACQTSQALMEPTQNARAAHQHIRIGVYQRGEHAAVQPHADARRREQFHPSAR